MLEFFILLFVLVKYSVCSGKLFIRYKEFNSVDGENWQQKVCGSSTCEIEIEGIVKTRTGKTLFYHYAEVAKSVFTDSMGHGKNLREYHYNNNLPKTVLFQVIFKYKPNIFTKEKIIDSISQSVPVSLPGSSSVISGRLIALTVEIYSKCDPNFYGVLCDVRCVAPDSNHMCHSDNGTLMCKPGWIGSDCQHEDQCFVSSPCENGGKCFSRNDSFFCLCQENYIGPTCNSTIQTTSSVRPMNRQNTSHGNLKTLKNIGWIRSESFVIIVAVAIGGSFMLLSICMVAIVKHKYSRNKKRLRNFQRTLPATFASNQVYYVTRNNILQDRENDYSCEEQLDEARCESLYEAVDDDENTYEDVNFKEAKLVLTSEEDNEMSSPVDNLCYVTGIEQEK